MYNQENCKFAKTHEWAFIDGDTAVFGISDHAQSEISDIVFIELPKVGATVTAGKQCAVIESVKSASDFYAPLCGTVTEVNEAVKADPSLINKSAHGDGWFFKVKLTNQAEAANLLAFADYKASI